MTTGLDVFDTTVQKTNLWLKRIMEELHWDDRQRAYDALRAALQALRDRLTIEQAAKLGAQLPMLIRGLYYEGWDPTGKPLKERRVEEFLAHIPPYFRGEPFVDSERVVRAVYKVLAENISEGELEDVRGMMPEDIRDLLPEAA